MPSSDTSKSILMWEKELVERLKEIGMTKSKLRQQLSEWDSHDRGRLQWVAEMIQITTSPMFFGARTWEDLCALYELYFRGYLPAVPTQPSPLNINSTYQAEQLANLTRLGMITIRTQPGNCDSDERERAYIDAYVNSSQIDVEELFRSLNKRNVLVTVQTRTYRAASEDDTSYFSNLSQSLSSWKPIPERYANDAFMKRTLYTGRAPGNNEFVEGRPGSGDKRIPVSLNEDGSARRWWIPHSIFVTNNGEISAADRDLLYASWRLIQETSPSLEDGLDEQVVFLRVLHSDFCKSDLLTTVKAAVKDARVDRSPTSGNFRKRLNSYNPLRRSLGGRR